MTNAVRASLLLHDQKDSHLIPVRNLLDSPVGGAWNTHRGNRSEVSRSHGSRRVVERFDEWQGKVTLTIPVAVRATSGRPKHTDPVEVAASIRDGVKSAMDRVYADADDVQIGEIVETGADGTWTTW